MSPRTFALLLLAACSVNSPASPASDASPENPGGPDALAAFPAPLVPADFTGALDKPYIRGFQTWLTDPAFETKWQSMLLAPIELLGGASSAYHADLARLALPLPGGQVICHGDPKFDNFGWQIVDGAGAFGVNDFDDSDNCPAAADALRDLLATDLWFADPALDELALQAYVATVIDPAAAVAVDPTTEPVWTDVRAKGLMKDTSNGKLVLGGEVQAALPAEVTAVTDLIAHDPRLAMPVLDVARDVRTTGGSAGLRRFWALVDLGGGTRTILELKEEGKPATQFGAHATSIDPAMRLEVLKPYWWHATDAGDHFDVSFLGARFLVRDRLTRVNPKPTKLTAAQIANVIQAEASQLGLRHRAAWPAVDRDTLTTWLRTSTATLVARWRAAYTAAGGA